MFPTLLSSQFACVRFSVPCSSVLLFCAVRIRPLDRARCVFRSRVPIYMRKFTEGNARKRRRGGGEMRTSNVYVFPRFKRNVRARCSLHIIPLRKRREGTTNVYMYANTGNNPHVERWEGVSRSIRTRKERRNWKTLKRVTLCFLGERGRFFERWRERANMQHIMSKVTRNIPERNRSKTFR